MRLSLVNEIAKRMEVTALGKPSIDERKFIESAHIMA